MKIGIDASRAFVKQRTGIEEYSFMVIKHLLDKLDEHEVVLYVKETQNSKLKSQNLKLAIKNDFQINLPDNWVVKEIGFNYFWTQVGLAWEMLINPVDVLFVPAHTVPWIYPKNTVVTVHGLEYEHCPESYSFTSRLFHRFFIKKSCKWAKKIIAVSKNTKKDLIKLYGINKDKIDVVYNGAEINTKQAKQTGALKKKENHLLFIGRLEKRKNIEGIAKAFEILKEEYGYEGKLVLAGKPGHGYEELKQKMMLLNCRYDIEELGFISEEKKWKLIKNADVFMFPSISEGFGIPIIEAQSFGVPVITSNLGPMDEVAGNDDILVDPYKPDEIAKLANKLITDIDFRNEVIEKGLENVKRFSWEKCAKGISQILINF